MGALHESDTVLEEGVKKGEEEYEEGFGNAGRACFQFFLCLRWERERCKSKGERVSLLEGQGENSKERLWIMRKVKKELKEIKELLCVPNKRKNIVIRKLSAYANRRRPQFHFQYDPQSYALNFDQGHREDHDCARLDFSSRFVASLKVNSASVGSHCSS
ncbi:uncharacterized protein LOC122086831 [Macadamia integrifolia]|uniref:uncharacterized protein LOC122086831 n=1 Tax=Macadamia integrifolia TaxID=60698 RepID=UPI001C4F6986|nr:uncharacterized protein LOC122086831 [Macadamia integrifolia]